MSEEAKDEVDDDPGGDRARARWPSSRSTSRCPPSRSARCRSRSVDGEYQTLLGRARTRRAARRATRCWAWSRTWTSASCSSRRSSTSACSPPRSSSWPPTPGLIGVSPARLLDGHPPPAARRAAAAASRSTARRGSGSSSSAGFAILVTLPGQATFLGSVYSFGALLSLHDGAPRGDPAADDQAGLPAALPGPGQRASARASTGRCSRSRAASSPRSRSSSSSSCNPTVAVFGVAWLALGMVVYLLYRRRQGLDLTSTHKVAIPQPVVDHEAEYDSVLVPMGADALRRVGDRDRGQARRAAPARDPRAGDGHGAERAADRRADAGGRRPPPQSMIEQARVQAGARVSRATSSACAPARPGGGSSRRRIDMRAAAIVMPLPRRVNGASLFGKTLETVLAERPCRVIIESAPAPRRRRRRALSGRQSHEGLRSAGADGPDRRRADRAHAPAVGGRSRSGIMLGVLFIAAGAGPALRGAHAAMQRPTPLKRQLGLARRCSGSSRASSPPRSTSRPASSPSARSGSPGPSSWPAACCSR